MIVSTGSYLPSIFPRCRVLAFSLECRIEFGRGNVIQIVAHRLESDADQNLKYLILTVPCGQKVLDRLRVAHVRVEKRSPL